MSGKVWCARVLAICLVAGIVGAMPADNDKLTLRIIHTNDMHSRFFETSQHSGLCNEADAAAGKCYGGFARITTLVRRIRNEATEDKPVLFLNAGDTYQGTKMFSFYKWKIIARFLNILRPDAVSLGNHEFDDGVEGLVPYLNNITFPVVTANLDLSDEPTMKNSKQLKKSVILTVNNKKIGVVGYLTPETKTLSRPDNVRLLDEVEVLREETKKLKAQGCDIIIAVGHSGYEVDKKIGREVEDVDLVIGGHTNTFLYNGPQPDIEKPEGPYPTVVVQPSGRKVYIVQAYAYTKYLGDITIEFDRNGEITKAEGQPILVDSSIPKAMDVETELLEWEKPLINMTTAVVGKTKVLLQGDEKVCRLEECNFGNLLTDAMIDYYIKKVFRGDNGWTDTAIAVHQAGGIRSSVGSISDEKITMNDILTAFPFGSKLFKVSVDAKTLRDMLEWSVNDRLTQNTTSHGGAFLQYSGLQVTYDISKPLKSRLVSVKARCSICIVPVYEDLNTRSTYSVLMPDFMYNGGDGYSMLKGLDYQNLNITMAEVVAQYINNTGPVYPAVEGRIKFVLDNTANLKTHAKVAPNAASSYKSTHMPVIMTLIGFLAWLRLV